MTHLELHRGVRRIDVVIGCHQGAAINRQEASRALVIFIRSFLHIGVHNNSQDANLHIGIDNQRFIKIIIN